MSSNLKIIATIGAKACGDLGMPSVVKHGDGTRQGMEFIVMTGDGQIGISGTYDDIIDFGAEIMGRMFSWPLTHDHTDWFGQDDMEMIGKAVNDVGQHGSSGAGENGNGGRSGEREGQRGNGTEG